jgi:hypothetical protein
MSRILKRPMFRIGGPVNDGIMSMAAPRKNYEDGSDYKTRIDELKKIYRESAGPGPSRYNDLGDMLISGGLNILSGKSAGKGTLGAVAESFKEPYAAFAKSGAGEDAFQRQLDLAAATQGVTSVDAERIARLKLKGENKEAIIKLRGDELKAIGASPGLARVMTDYEERTGQKLFPLPINPADPRGYTDKELSAIDPGERFIDGRGNFFKKLENGKVVQINKNTDQIIQKEVAPKKIGFFEKLLTPSQPDKPNPYITSKQRFYEEYYRNNPGKRPQQDMG